MACRLGGVAEPSSIPPWTVLSGEMDEDVYGGKNEQRDGWLDNRPQISQRMSRESPANAFLLEMLSGRISWFGMVSL